jgi:GNAT superfamily N-acetyltransferase
VLSGHSWATEEVLDHIFAAKRVIGERVRARFFGAVVDGEVVSYSDLYQDGADAQIEDVGTLPERRDRGYASAVVLAAIEAARRDGAEFVCLVADANDWPKELYRRLGFDTVGHYTKFFAPGACERTLSQGSGEAVRVDHGARRRGRRRRGGRARSVCSGPTVPGSRRWSRSPAASSARRAARPRSAARRLVRARRCASSATSQSSSASRAGIPPTS